MCEASKAIPALAEVGEATFTYKNAASKHPWAIEIDGQKTGVGAYTDKPFVCITHTYGTSKKGGGCLHVYGRLLERMNAVMYRLPSFELSPSDRKQTPNPLTARLGLT